MTINFSTKRVVFPVYLIWMLVLAIHSGWIIYSSILSKEISQETLSSFLVGYIAIAVFVILLGAVFAWLTDKGVVWAKWGFVGYCGYRVIDSMLGANFPRTLDPGLLDNTGLAKNVVFSLVWLFLGWLAYHSQPAQTVGTETPMKSE